jgi:hypothetical protein
MFAGLALVLAACSTASDPAAGDDSKRESEALSDTSKLQSTEVSADLEPTSSPTTTPEPTAPAELIATVEPTAESKLSTEEPVNSVREIPPDFTEFQAEVFDIQLAYPDDWTISENPDLGLVVESSEGVFESMPRAEGAALLVFSRNELAREEIVEALRQSIFDFGPMPMVYIEQPTVAVIGDQVFATAPFSEDETGLAGYYVFVQSDDQGAFIFAITTKIARSSFLSLVETTLNSVILGDGGGNS